MLFQISCSKVFHQLFQTESDGTEDADPRLRPYPFPCPT